MSTRPWLADRPGRCAPARASLTSPSPPRSRPPHRSASSPSWMAAARWWRVRRSRASRRCPREDCGRAPWTTWRSGSTGRTSALVERSMADPLPTCYLNGDYLPLTEARISPLDRGFLYADGVYELMPVYGGRGFRFPAHAERLTRSLAGIRMADPHTREEWRAILAGLTEASASAVHVVKGGELRMPPHSQRILPGTTRGVVEELAERIALRCRAVGVSEAELRAADEVWISAATREVQPVTSLDGRPVGDGRPGRNWRRLYEELQRYKRELAGTPW